MKIALVGYGKMGHIIAQTARERSHNICTSIDPIASDADIKAANSAELAASVKNSGAEGIIEFTHPLSVMENIRALVPLGLPLVVGTTGWFEKLDEVKKLAKSFNTSIFYSANYSIGVNMFYRIVEQAARLMAQYTEYDTAVLEVHHRQKADSPSGTALDLAKLIMKANPDKTEAVSDAFHEKPQPQQLHVSSLRIGSFPGTHKVLFDSAADTIEISHSARSREGFSLGAVRALEWLSSGLAENRLKGGMVYTMTDILD